MACGKQQTTYKPDRYVIKHDRDVPKGSWAKEVMPWGCLDLDMEGTSSRGCTCKPSHMLFTAWTDVSDDVPCVHWCQPTVQLGCYVLPSRVTDIGTTYRVLRAVCTARTENLNASIQHVFEEFGDLRGLCRM